MPEILTMLNSAVDFNRLSPHTGELDMRLEEIKEIAKQHGIKSGKLKKAELVRAIQSAEGNDSCFETGRSSICGQDECLWRADCT
jgi:hypothetical protein